MRNVFVAGNEDDEASSIPTVKMMARPVEPARRYKGLPSCLKTGQRRWGKWGRIAKLDRQTNLLNSREVGRN